MRNEDFAVHVRRRRFVSKIICEGVVGGGCNGNQSIFMTKVVLKSAHVPILKGNETFRE